MRRNKYNKQVIMEQFLHMAKKVKNVLALILCVVLVIESVKEDGIITLAANILSAAALTENVPTQTVTDNNANDANVLSLGQEPVVLSEADTIVFNEVEHVKTAYSMNIFVPVTWTGENGMTDFRPAPEDMPFKVYAGKTGENPGVELSTVITATAGGYYLEVPVYVQKDSGNSYATSEGFYVVECGESMTGYTRTSAQNLTVSLSVDTNELEWTAMTAEAAYEMAKLIDKEFVITWNDNRNKAGERPNSSGDTYSGGFEDNVELYYLETGKTEFIKVDSADFVDKNANAAKISRATYNSWSCSFTNLPEKYNNQEGEYYIALVNTDEFSGKYKVQYTGEVSAYTASEVILTYQNVFTGTLEWLDRGDSSFRPTNAEGLKLHVFSVIDKTDAGLTTTDITDTISAADISWEYLADSRWNFSISNLPQYSLTDNGKSILYYVTLTDSGEETAPVEYRLQAAKESEDGEYYRLTYDNGTVSTETNRCYDGQIMRAVLTGNTKFSATKEWKDGSGGAASEELIGKRQATNATLYLWRHLNGENPEQGAPVTQSGNQFTYALQDTDFSSDTITITFSNFQTGVDTMPKYDEKGNVYIYYITESMKNDCGYRKVFTSQDTDHNTTAATVLYNGGILKNVRTAQIKLSARKQWLAAGVDSYQGSTASFVVQRKGKEASEWESALKTDGSELTAIVDGFSASVWSKNFTFDETEVYDDNGEEYEFRVIETAVTKEMLGATLSAAGYTQADDSAVYEQEYSFDGYAYKATCSYVGNPATAQGYYLIQNKLGGKMLFTIEKQWEKFAQENLQDIEITLKQNGTALATVTLYKDSNTALVDYVQEGISDVTIAMEKSETSDENGIKYTWTCAELTLEAFDNVGRQYVYSVEEAALTLPPTDTYGYETFYGYSYADKTDNAGNKVLTCKATVRNVKYTGSGSYEYVTVEKKWQDNYETQKRKPVTVHVVKVAADGKIIQDMALPEDASYTPAEGYYTATLSPANNWTSHIRINSIDLNEGEAFAVIEYQIGEKRTSMGEEASSWQEGTFTSASATEPSYKIAIQANEDKKYFTITNTYSKNVVFYADKTWKDSANIYDTRKDVVIKLYRESDGSETEVSGYEVTWTIDSEGGNRNSNEYEEKIFQNASASGADKFLLPLYDSQGNAYLYTAKEYMKVSGENGKETLTEVGSSSLNPADMPYVSQVTETTNILETADKTKLAEKLKTEAGVSDETAKELVSAMDSSVTFSFTNTISHMKGEKSFYVIWHDEDNLSYRPDVRFTLYRRVLNTSDYEKCTDDVTVVWTSAGTEGNNPFYQKATFTGMELFDADGNAYEYAAAQTIRNGSKYSSEYFAPTKKALEAHTPAYMKKAVTVSGQTYSHWTVDKELVTEVNAPTTVSEEEIYLLPEDGVVINSIHDFIHVKGSKTWLGLSVDTDIADLPDAYIRLYRSSPYDAENKLPEETTPALPTEDSVSTLQGGIAGTYLDDNKENYAFYEESSISNPKEYAAFDKYDTYGARYEYAITEAILGHVDATSDGTFLIPTAVMGYTTNNLNLYNMYKKDTNKMNLQIEKQWDYKESAETTYPYAKFEIYRYTQKPILSGGVPQTTVSNPAEIPSDENEWKPVDTIILASGGKISCTSESIPVDIFAPNGDLYVYFVREVESFTSAYRATAATAIFMNGGIALNAALSANTQKVVFKNEYKASELIASITGEKRWEEQTVGTRPAISEDGVCSDIKITVSRRALSQVGNNAVPISNATENKTYTDEEVKVVWTTSEDTGNWTYTITPQNSVTFPEYSINGNPYIYTVTESYNGV